MQGKVNKYDAAIRDAIMDERDNCYVGFGDGETRFYMPLADLHSIDRSVVERLSRAGVQVLASRDKEDLKVAAQSIKNFRLVSIVKGAGWSGATYALPDGRTAMPKNVRAETISAFEPDSAFAASGSLLAWQEAIAPFVTGQPLVLFCLAFGLVGPLLRFAPSHMQNPVIELVGEKEKGKSTLAKLMSSVWGGDPNAKLGICYDWDFTPAELDPLRLSRKDGLLILDEVNRAADDETQKAKIVEKAIFKLADTTSRRRFGQPAVESIKQAVVSTSNVPIRELSSMPRGVKDAMLSRILSLACDRRYGVLDTLPEGYGTAKEAVEAADLAATLNFGTAGHAFVSRLAQLKTEVIAQAIAKGMRRAENLGLSNAAQHGARVSKTIGITFTTALLARELGVFPKSWGSPRRAVQALFEGLAPEEVCSPPPCPLALIRRFVEANQDHILLPTSTCLPLSADHFHCVPGIWIEPGERLLVSPPFLEGHLRDARSLLKQLRDEGRLSCDNGQLTKKAPRRFVTGCRAHFIDVTTEEGECGRDASTAPC